MVEKINIRGNLAKLLSSFNETIYYYPNQGNAGDSLIDCAARQFFKVNGISFEIIDDPSFWVQVELSVIGGGGNFGGIQSRCSQFVSRYKDSAKKLLIMPHTIYDVQALLEVLDERVHIICREQVSFDYVCKHAVEANVYLHDDIVFTCNVQELLAHKPRVNFFPHIVTEIAMKMRGRTDYDFGLALRGFMSYSYYMLKKSLFGAPKSRVLYAFRTDSEKTSITIPKGNIDLSAVLELGACKPDISSMSCYQFLSAINHFDEVHTNRLHIAIGAALLGKQVNLHGNNYFKIRAIYEFSMAGKFANVTWVD